MSKKRIVVAATGASGLPILITCLNIIKGNPEFESHLILSDSAVVTLKQETKISVEALVKMADVVYSNDSIGECPASGSFKTEGMLVVPCSMKTLSGVHSGYADNLILRSADVTIKEQRTLVLAVRETPLSAIHLLPSIRTSTLILSGFREMSSLMRTRTFLKAAHYSDIYKRIKQD